MGIVSHAEKELEKIGALEDWPIYKPILELFASQRHSGGSASVVIPILTKLLNQEELSPITNNPDEWVDRSECSGYPCWQNNRNSTYFSKDAGKTWVKLKDKNFKKYW